MRQICISCSFKPSIRRLLQLLIYHCLLFVWKCGRKTCRLSFIGNRSDILLRQADDFKTSLQPIVYTQKVSDAMLVWHQSVWIIIITNINVLFWRLSRHRQEGKQQAHLPWCIHVSRIRAFYDKRQQQQYICSLRRHCASVAVLQHPLQLSAHVLRAVSWCGSWRTKCHMSHVGSAMKFDVSAAGGRRCHRTSARDSCSRRRLALCTFVLSRSSAFSDLNTSLRIS